MGRIRADAPRSASPLANAGMSIAEERKCDNHAAASLC